MVFRSEPEMRAMGRDIPRREAGGRELKNKHRKIFQ